MDCVAPTAFFGRLMYCCSIVEYFQKENVFFGWLRSKYFNQSESTKQNLSLHSPFLLNIQDMGSHAANYWTHERSSFWKLMETFSVNTLSLTCTTRARMMELLRPCSQNSWSILKILYCKNGHPTCSFFRLKKTFLQREDWVPLSVLDVFKNLDQLTIMGKLASCMMNGSSSTLAWASSWPLTSQLLLPVWTVRDFSTLKRERHWISNIWIQRLFGFPHFPHLTCFCCCFHL